MDGLGRLFVALLQFWRCESILEAVFELKPVIRTWLNSPKDLKSSKIFHYSPKQFNMETNIDLLKSKQIPFPNIIMLYIFRVPC